MKKKALRKDFIMEIRRSLGRFLSIFFIVAIGVAFFSGIRSAEPDMRLSGDAYFDENELMDLKVVSTLGLTDSDVEALKELEHVEDVEPGYSMDALLSVHDSKKVVHIMSLLPKMNKVTVEEGRLPQKEDECLMDAGFLKDSGYKIGDQITFTTGTDASISDTLVTDTFTITGTASSPCYISFGRGSSMIGTGSVSAFVVVPPESFSLDVYTELYLTAQGAKDVTAFTDEYDAVVDKAQDDVTSIKEERQKARHDEIVAEAQQELDKAEAQLEDGRAEAQAQLDDAWNQISSGQDQLYAARAEIESGREQIETARSVLDDKQAEITAGYDALTEQTAEFDKKAAEFEQAEATLKALEQSGTADETVLQPMREQLEAARVQLEEGRTQLETARTQLEEGQTAIDAGKAELTSKESQLQAGLAQIGEKEQELVNARAEYDSAKAEAEKKIQDGEKKIQDAQDEISKIQNAKWYISDRDSLTDYSGYGENADRMKAIGKVFPVLFFLVAALISLTTMTRMVEEQRTQIGTLKALGYSRSAISMKFIGYAFIATVAGSIVGVLIGEKILPFIIITAYGIMYDYIHVVLIPYNVYYGVIAAAAALGCTLLATFFSCNRELKEQAAQLMRPPAPKQGKRVFMEKIPFVWKHLNFIWKATVRNLIRYKKRFFMTIFGIGGCMALLLVGFGLKDSIFDIAILQYSDIQLYDANVILDADASAEEKAEPYEMLANEERVDESMKNHLQNVKIMHGDKEKDVYMNVPSDVETFPDFIVLRDRTTHKGYELTDEGVVLTEKMAAMLDVKPGDTIQIKDDIKGEVEVKVTAVSENYMGHFLYMTPSLYEELFGREPDYNSIYYTMKEENPESLREVGESLLESEGALSISYTDTLEDQLDDMLGSLNIVLVVLVISAGMLAFVVLYNLNNINITERQRELATLKVLGFYDNEVGAYVYRENIILTIIGAFFGMLLGRFLHRFVIVTVEIESVMFGRNINLDSFIFSFLITIGFSLFVNWVMYFKLKKIDMVESLKSVE